MEPETTRAIQDFIEEQYTPDRMKSREELAQSVMDLCADRLRREEILAFCKCRTKSETSMRKKLQKLWERGEWRTLDDIRGMECLDFVGVRICLYFMSEIDKVQKLLQEQPGLQLVQIMHFGKFGTEEKHKGIRPYLERSGAYEAKHFWIEVSPNMPGLRDRADSVKGHKVEIQVRSAFMEAWAEMQHDLTYKLAPESSDDEECRILKDIRQTTKTCEAMAERLRDVHRRKVRRSTFVQAKI